MSTTQPPKWLTPIIELSAFSGDPTKYLDHLFSIFKRDFIIAQPTFNDRPVHIGNPNLFKGKPECFWHVTSQEDKVTGERIPDLRRCERVEWIRLVIEHSKDNDVWVWPKQNKRELRHNLFLANEDFLVVLIEKKKFYLVTAFYVDYSHTKVKLREEYENYTKKTKSAP